MDTPTPTTEGLVADNGNCQQQQSTQPELTSSSLPSMQPSKTSTTKVEHFLPSSLNPLTRRVYVRELLRKMPPSVQNRVTVLKNLQIKYHGLQVDYFREIFELEKKYHKLYQHLYEKREKIVSGEIDPPAELPNWKSIPDEIEQAVDLKEFEQNFKEVENMPADIKGVPNFWLNIFRNSDTISQIVYEHDVPALRYLRDLKINYNDENSFSLEFHFDENPYFTNQKLTKEYFLKNSVDKEYPFGFEGLEIYKSKGCHIDWKDKMNLTMKTVRKRMRHRNTGAMRTTLKQVPRDSFFDFFSPPEVRAGNLESLDEETQALLEVDFEIGHFIREEIIPKAVLYFTGDIIDDEDDDDTSCETDEESNSGDLNEKNDFSIDKIADMLNDTIVHN